MEGWKTGRLEDWVPILPSPSSIHPMKCQRFPLTENIVEKGRGVKAPRLFCLLSESRIFADFWGLGVSGVFVKKMRVGESGGFRAQTNSLWYKEAVSRKHRGYKPLPEIGVVTIQWLCLKNEMYCFFHFFLERTTKNRGR